MTHATLKRLSHSKRVDYKDKPVAFLKRKRDEMKHFETDLKTVIKKALFILFREISSM
jgi:hypothetical protein